ncbi:hypothetical protein [Agrococcus sp. DT81.2]|uniref:hypothetical protein n=1 Tax=Agrococcus sp. DT81.2 TaxID=3393414 RepID=UPI003CE4800F
MTMQAEDLARNDRFKADVVAGLTTGYLAAKYATGETRAKVAARLVRFALEAHVPTVTTTTEEASDGTRTVEAIRDRPVTLADARAWIQASGDDPDDYKLSIRAIAYGQDMFSNRMSATPIPGARKLENPITPADIQRLSSMLWDTPAQAHPVTTSTPVAAILNLSDIQYGKGSPEATLKRIRNGVAKFIAYVARQRAAGVNIDEIVVVNNGDPFEGIAGNYANQTATVMRGGLRAQMKGVLELWTWVAGQVFPLAPKGQFVTVLCNHTQFGRQGGAKDSITSDSDNGSAFLAEALQMIVADKLPHVTFTIPHDEFNVYADVAGVKVGFNHGHKIPGSGEVSFVKWLGGQVRYDPRAYEAKVWVTAHRHHYAAYDVGSAFVYQCPSCDDGSKWLTDTTGIHARSGLLAFLIGNHDPLHTSDAVFL